MRILIIISFLGASFFSFAQNNFSASMQTVFIDEADKGIYSGGLQLKAGSIKVNQTITAVDEVNQKVQFTITEIKDYDTDKKVNVLTGQKSAFVVLKLLMARK